jgi:hypothetical protein
MSRRSPLRSSFLRLTAIALGATAVLGLVAPQAPATSRSRSLPPMVVDAPENPIAPGGTMDVRVLFAGSTSATIRYSLSGLPLGTTASLTTRTTRERRLRVTLPVNAPPGLYQGVFRTLNPGTKRIDTFLVNVSAPVTVPPTAPPTVPPPTAAPIPVQFQIGTPENSKILRLGGAVSFPIQINRQGGWQGPVQLVLEGLPSGASAGFLPFNPTSDPSSDLRLVIPTTASPGDYTLRVIATAGDVRRDLPLTLRIRGTEGIALLVVSGGNAEVGRTTRIGELEATVVNGDGGPVTLSTEGLPAGITIGFGQNPLLGRTPVNATIAAGVALNTYNFFIVGRKGDAVSKQSASVRVIAAPAIPTLRYTPTPVAAVPGESAGFGLAANPFSLGIPRGGTLQFGVTITPRGGFASPIDITVNGLPSGVVGSVEATGTANQLRVTLTVPAGASTGATTLTIRGISGSLRGEIGVPFTIT